MADKLVLDLETKKSFDEVGGQQNAHLLEISVVGVYSYDKNEYRTFKESDFAELEDWLKKAGLVIGFNSKSFDFAVLQPYFRWKLDRVPHLDILEEVVHARGHRLKLDSIATTTLGEGKSGSGLDAIWYYRNKEWEKLIKYCLDDVKVTKEIYEYGMRHGHMWFTDRGQKTAIPVRWAQDKKILDILEEAQKFGYKVTIDYLGRGDERRIMKEIDVREIIGDKLKAFDHHSGLNKDFAIDRIYDIDIMGAADSFQERLI
ncbi:ribonuclease H-like domain-containing protein [Patescibacteria group bacterium]|nr:ribonuclease H-like domain-containing protein [Patescibacteria group bacterium]